MSGSSGAKPPETKPLVWAVSGIAVSCEPQSLRRGRPLRGQKFPVPRSTARIARRGERCRGRYLALLDKIHASLPPPRNIWYTRYNPVTQIWGEPRQITRHPGTREFTLRLARTRRLVLALLEPRRRNPGLFPTVLSEAFSLHLAERGYRADERRDTACHGVSLTFADGIQPGGSELEVLSRLEPNGFNIFAGAALVRGRLVRVRNNLRYSTQPWTNPQRAAHAGVAVFRRSPFPRVRPGAPPCVDIVYLDVWDCEVGSAEDANLINPAIGVETSWMASAKLSPTASRTVLSQCRRWIKRRRCARERASR